MTTTTNTVPAKAVTMTVAGQDVNVIVQADHYPMFLEGLLKKVFRTVRVSDTELPIKEEVQDTRPAPTKPNRKPFTTSWYEGRNVFCKVGGKRYKRRSNPQPTLLAAKKLKEVMDTLGTISPKLWDLDNK